MSSNRFPKSQRLSRKKLWEAVFENGTRLKAYPLALYVLQAPLPGAVPVQAGFAVPKRNFRKAVQRNRVKRLMREAYRLERQAYFNTLERPFALVFLYLGKDIPDFGQVTTAMKAVLKKFETYEATSQIKADHSAPGPDRLPDGHGIQE
ncbi:ribonuclease P protein component [Robiginitalea aurantiaca]|uniref:Ribonuclease P protein component n=1 Tax=Robiginitalea aurantiaca TaxID=3056915 RepID=A0ABT7WAA6_9FLAO|nr:ribonuclease P protein component [Robiginitalea aurantiaca]MDM9629851.1 ribonuclease P protein component [Robiginitalea aurantiaca]